MTFEEWFGTHTEFIEGCRLSNCLIVVYERLIEKAWDYRQKEIDDLKELVRELQKQNNEFEEENARLWSEK